MDQIPAGYQRVALLLKPLDVLFFRNNKSMDASQVAVGTEDPYPQTLYGAIFTSLLQSYEPSILNQWGKVFAKNGGDSNKTIDDLSLPSWLKQVYLRGPWLAKRKHEKIILFFRSPSTLLQSKTKGTHTLNQLRPLNDQLPGWMKEKNLFPLWCKTSETLEPINQFITLEGMKKFLSGELHDGNDDWFMKSSELIAQDRRTGIEIDPKLLSAKKSRIYGIAFLSLAPDVYYYAELIIQNEVDIKQLLPENFILHWGGEKRMVSLEWVECVNWSVNHQQNGKTFFVLLSPAIFQHGWKPDAFPESPCSAKIQSNQAVSGWNYAKNAPKPTRFAVPAGSVYFYENSLNLSDHNSLCTCEEYIKQGWGLAMKGNWNYA